MALPIHKHLLIRAEIKNPPGADDVEATKDWVRNLIETIDMKLLAGPFCEYVHVEGNAGITAVSIIETSHIAMHIWDEPSPALLQLDVYTCGPFKPIQVFEKINEAWDATKLEWKYLDREHEFKTEHVGKWHGEDGELPNHHVLNNG
jgi:S-adenosylmethionine/arginine decarboxylase-like enzyme